MHERRRQQEGMRLLAYGRQWYRRTSCRQQHERARIIWWMLDGVNES
jgi:hypothetical protein